jgi:hypothetical protein
MDQETRNFILSAMSIPFLLIFLYIVGRVIGAILGVWSSLLIAPLAPLIDGAVDWKSSCIKGTYQGRNICAYSTPKQNLGSGESATWIHAFHIEVSDLTGKQDWQIHFMQTGMFGQGDKRLTIGVRDEALGERLYDSGVIAQVGRVSSPTDSYVTVKYETKRGILTYTDDVSPKRIPSREQFEAQLALAAVLATLNEQVNSI